MDLMEKLKSIEWLDSSDRRVSEISRLLFNGSGGFTGNGKKVGIKRAFPGLTWSSEIADGSSYFQLYRRVVCTKINSLDVAVTYFNNIIL
jgi:hypothetical protein